MEEDIKNNHFQAFLKKLFHLFDQDNDEQLGQDDWIKFLKNRLP